jgi:hypothetical protein
MTPVINELIYAVSLGFFDDILIPHQNLQHPKRLYPLAMLKTLFIKFMLFVPNWGLISKMGGYPSLDIDFHP